MRRNPISAEYQVRPGDSLWTIARNQYNDPALWPLIANENRIDRKMKIIVGQRLRLPRITAGEAKVAPPAFDYARLAPEVSHAINGAIYAAYPAYEFDMRAVKETFYGPGYKLTFRMKGKLTLQRRGTLENFYLVNLKKIEVECKEEIAKAIACTAAAKLSFDVGKRRVDVSCELISTVTTLGGSKLTHKLETGDGLRSIKYVCQTEPVAGVYHRLAIEGVMGYEIEVELDRPPEKESLVYSSSFSPQTFLLHLAAFLAIAALLVLVMMTLKGAVIVGAGVVAFAAIYLPLRGNK